MIAFKRDKKEEEDGNYQLQLRRFSYEHIVK